MLRIFVAFILMATLHFTFLCLINILRPPLDGRWDDEMMLCRQLLVVIANSLLLLPTRSPSVRMTSSHIVLVALIVFSSTLMFGKGFCHTDAFVAAGGVGCKNKKCPTINTALFSTQPPPRRLLKKVISNRNDYVVDARIFHAVWHCFQIPILQHTYELTYYHLSSEKE